MQRNSTAISPQSRHPGLNWGPTDYELVQASRRAHPSLSERVTPGRSDRTHFTTRPQRKPPHWQLAALLAAYAVFCAWMVFGGTEAKPTTRPPVDASVMGMRLEGANR